MANSESREICKELGFEKEFFQLETIRRVLSAHGLKICDYPREIINEQFRKKYMFPLVYDGAQGIRASLSRKGGLLVSFTNGFEDPKHPKRVELTSALLEEGIEVV